MHIYTLDRDHLTSPPTPPAHTYSLVRLHHPFPAPPTPPSPPHPPHSTCPSAKCSQTLRLSVVNLQPRPVLVYAALVHAVGPESIAEELPLSPWEGSQPEEEWPCPLAPRSSAGGVSGRGANCLLLAPYEGLPTCTAEDAEVAPFGESNTFRHVAATGQPIALSSAARLHVEVAFQSQHAAQDSALGLLGEAYGDDATPEDPFCILTLPLQHLALGSLGS